MKEVIPNSRWRAPMYIREMVWCIALSDVFRLVRICDNYNEFTRMTQRWTGQTCTCVMCKCIILIINFYVILCETFCDEIYVLECQYYQLCVLFVKYNCRYFLFTGFVYCFISMC